MNIARVKLIVVALGGFLAGGCLVATCYAILRPGDQIDIFNAVVSLLGFVAIAAAFVMQMIEFSTSRADAMEQRAESDKARYFDQFTRLLTRLETQTRELTLRHGNDDPVGLAAYAVAAKAIRDYRSEAKPNEGFANESFQWLNRMSRHSEGHFDAIGRIMRSVGSIARRPVWNDQDREMLQQLIEVTMSPDLQLVLGAACQLQLDPIVHKDLREVLALLGMDLAPISETHLALINDKFRK